MIDPESTNKTQLEQTWDAAAPTWDNIWYFKECGQRLIEILPINRGANVLDVATGTGLILLPAARRVGVKGHVVGIDLSSAMLELAKQVVIENGLHNTDLLKMDAEHLDFPDASFDAVTCGFSIHLFEHRAFQEMYRVCKLGGFIGVSVFDKTVPESRRLSRVFRQVIKSHNIEIPFSFVSFAPEEVESLLASYGFNHKKTFRETKKHVYANAEEYWEKVILSGGSRMIVMNMDEGMREQIKEEFFSKLKLLINADGLLYDVPVIYTLAQK